jgi:hypothetical protein
MWRVRALLFATMFAATACSPGGLFERFEYEEDIYLSVDGSATVYVNGSVAALNALRGASFDTSPVRPVDRAKVREFFTTPVTQVAATPTTSRRSGRRFVHVRLDVRDVRKLGAAPPFAWSSYSLTRADDLFLYKQRIGAAAGKPIGDVGWNGGELVAFRLHLPSEIVYHNAGPGNPKRGNILVWQQRLTDRLMGKPLVPDPDRSLDVRMKTQSILYTTLWLFGATFAAVVAGFVILIWWILRRAPAPAARV